MERDFRRTLQAAVKHNIYGFMRKPILDIGVMEAEITRPAGE